MYLAEKPLAQNPFLMGERPWYIIGLEFAGVLHMFLMDIVFRIIPNYSQRDTIP